MSAETRRGFLLAGVLLGPTAAAQDGAVPVDEMHEKDLLLARLFELQRRVRSGEMPGERELSAGRATRESVLADLDFERATQLGFEPRALRDRLLPGFLAEFELLDAQRARLDVGPPPRPSPLLTMVLDVEQDLWREADRRRQRLGLKSPLDSGPLSQKLQPDAPADGSEPAAGGAQPTAAERAAPAAARGPPAGVDPWIFGQAHYRVGRYGEALAAWKELAPPAGDAGLMFEYQRADCQLRCGQVDEAIAAWEKLATGHSGTSWGAQAEFALKVARTLKAVRTAAAGEKP
jgi:hypothetical protein